MHDKKPKLYRIVWDDPMYPASFSVIICEIEKEDAHFFYIKTRNRPEGYAIAKSQIKKITPYQDFSEVSTKCWNCGQQKDPLTGCDCGGR